MFSVLLLQAASAVLKDDSPKSPLRTTFKGIYAQILRDSTYRVLNGQTMQALRKVLTKAAQHQAGGRGDAQSSSLCSRTGASDTACQAKTREVLSKAKEKLGFSKSPTEESQTRRASNWMYHVFFGGLKRQMTSLKGVLKRRFSVWGQVEEEEEEEETLAEDADLAQPAEKGKERHADDGAPRFFPFTASHRSVRYASPGFMELQAAGARLTKAAFIQHTYACTYKMSVHTRYLYKYPYSREVFSCVDLYRSTSPYIQLCASVSLYHSNKNSLLMKFELAVVRGKIQTSAPHAASLSLALCQSTLPSVPHLLVLQVEGVESFEREDTLTQRRLSPSSTYSAFSSRSHQMSSLYTPVSVLHSSVALVSCLPGLWGSSAGWACSHESTPHRSSTFLTTLAVGLASGAFTTLATSPLEAARRYIIAKTSEEDASQESANPSETNEEAKSPATKTALRFQGILEERGSLCGQCRHIRQY